MTTDIHELSNRQALFIGYFLCVLIDLMALNLFDEYWHHEENNLITGSDAIMLSKSLMLNYLLFPDNSSY